MQMLAISVIMVPLTVPAALGEWGPDITVVSGKGIEHANIGAHTRGVNAYHTSSVARGTREGVRSADDRESAGLASPLPSLNRRLFQPENETSEQPDTAASTSVADLAKKLSNPIASLISLPIQFNFDQNIGPDDDGERFQVNIQPVIPFSISKDWNLISRTIIPVISQSDIAPGLGDQFGLGDITQSLFFSPKAPTSNGIIWGVGPVFLVPTATDELLGAEKFGIGPTIVVLKQSKGWTYGALANHIWSVAGEDDREDVNSTFMQPFVSYTTPKAWTFALNTETSFNWTTEDWSVPVNLTAASCFESEVRRFNSVRALGTGRRALRGVLKGSARAPASRSCFPFNPGVVETPTTGKHLP